MNKSFITTGPGYDPTVKRVSCLIVNAKCIDLIEKGSYFTDGL